MIRFLIFGFAAALLAACGAKTTPTYHADENPQLLSEWGQLSIQDGELRLSDGVTPYDLNSPLFSDYAQKLRTVWISGGKAAAYKDKDVFSFPTGTVITKTFYYAKGDDGSVTRQAINLTPGGALSLDNIRLVETRILVMRAEKWVALPYVWNEEQTEATLSRTGDAQKMTLSHDGTQSDFTYIVPNVNQCAGCHAIDSTTKDIQPIGPKARHLNKDYEYADGVENQLQYWASKYIIESAPAAAPANAVWTDSSETIANRARAYLDINCSHCHSETGPADTSGLHLTPETPLGAHLGICKTPIAAGRGTGDRKFGIVPGNAERSIFTYRMESTNPAIMMPELGRALRHDEGVALIREWIDGLEGGCAP